MSQHHSVRRTLLAALLSSIGSLASIAAHADDPQLRPGSFAAIMAIKDPAQFGPHLPVADLPSTYQAAVPGSSAAIAAIKDPSHSGPHLAAADVPSPHVAPLPGSSTAILAVKDQANFDPHLPAADGLSGATQPAAGSLAADGNRGSDLRSCDTPC